MWCKNEETRAKAYAILLLLLLLTNTASAVVMGWHPRKVGKVKVKTSRSALVPDPAEASGSVEDLPKVRVSLYSRTVKSE